MRPARGIGIILGMSVAFAALGVRADAQLPQASADAPHVHVALVAPGELVRGAMTEAGLYFKLEPGWHVYWKNAGDAGEPPRIRWTLPKGITASELEFPPPKRLPLGPLMDFGYEGEVVFPFTLQTTGNAALGMARMEARVSWLVCREVCLPGHAELRLERTVVAKAGGGNAGAASSGAEPADLMLLTRYEAILPRPLPTNMHAVFAPTADGFRLAILTGHRESAAVFFPADKGILENAAAERAAPVADGVVLSLKKDSNLSATPAKLAGLVEFSDGRAFEFVAAPGVVPATGQATGGATSWTDVARKAALAFLGGVILNLMPCVFPVLFLKGLALVESSGEERRKMRGHGEVYATGILVSFWALVAVLLGLRAAGATLGWGFQFQSPVFVSLMAALLFFLGLSLAGQFEIGLTLTSAGGTLAQKQGYAGSFFTGVLAVVVATPCTAPFMGAAIGYALAQSALVTFVVFTALGLGLAAPYLLLTFQPAWTRLLPRPGAWMEVLKQATAVPIFATVIWLAWVLAETRGATGVAVLLGTFLLLAIAGWVLGRWPAKRVPTVIAAAILLGAVAGCVYGVVMLTAPVAASGVAQAGAKSAGWEPWSEAAVEKYRAEGRPVFVDFTASWCLSCQVNERVALRTKAVESAFRAKHVALLRADWTEHDDAITEVLTSLGRSGVPAYVLYAPGANGQTTLLPEVLTPGIVLDALRKLP
uniref:Thiol:disulfide interchange protein-like protein n=1 Tax=mine drainage metagenome TaxID=410659 RepID=E6QN60_9ZZZZ